MFQLPSLPRTLAAALRDLRSEKPAVRASAIRDLAPHAGAARGEVIGALEQALGDSAAPVRANAATALADLGAREAVDALIAAVDDADLHVRQMAVAALGELGDERAAERVGRALGDPQPELRFQAVIAFPRVTQGGDAATTALLRASNDDDHLVVHIALRMAEELADGGGGVVDSRIVRRARALLRHDSARVRAGAAVLLARTGDPDAVDRAAREALSSAAIGDLPGIDPEDEAAAIELVGELGIRSALPGLERRAFGGLFFRRDRFAWHARVALARMGHERASREIVGDLSARDRDRRTLAVAAAGRAHLVGARELIVAMRGDADRADPHAVDEALAALAVSEAG